MSDSTLWWAAVGIAVAVELASGTFYLLMLAIGLAAAALAAHAGAAAPEQFVLAAAIAGAGVTGLHLLRRQRRNVVPWNANSDANRDICEIVQVAGWDEDGTATVRYRGSNWTVVAAVGTGHHLGAHRVQAVVGNKLIIEKA